MGLQSVGHDWETLNVKKRKKNFVFSLLIYKMSSYITGNTFVGYMFSISFVFSFYGDFWSLENLNFETD